MDPIAFSIVTMPRYTEVYDNDYAALRMLVVNREDLNSIPSEEWNVAGFYILLNGTAKKWNAYVGKAPSGIKKRVTSHIKGKEFWTRAILIRRDTSNGFSSAAAGWLESRFYDILMDLEHCTIENSVKPVDDTLPEYTTVGLERTTLPVMSLLKFLGYSLEDTPKKRSKGDHISPNAVEVVKGQIESGIEGNTSLIELLKAGILSPGTLISLEPKYPGRAELNADGTISFDGSIYASPSGAGLACRRLIRPESTSPNGWDFWGMADDNGKTKSLGTIRKTRRD